jgi:hypothetical protein
MAVTFDFTQPFTGVVYANKHYEQSACRWDGNGSTSITVNIPLSTRLNTTANCGVAVQEVRARAYTHTGTYTM